MFYLRLCLLELWHEVKINDENNEENKDIPSVIIQDQIENGQNKGKSASSDEIELDSKERKKYEDEDEDVEEDIEFEGKHLLQTALKVAELAKEIYSHNNDNVNVAKSYFKLGEIHISLKNYLLSIEYMSKSLELQKNISIVDNRLKNNTHLNLCIAYAASQNVKKSVEHLDAAKFVFEAQISYLSRMLQLFNQTNITEINAIKEEILTIMDTQALERNKSEFEKAFFKVMKNRMSDDNVFNGSDQVSNSSKLAQSSSNYSLGARNTNNTTDNSTIAMTEEVSLSEKTRFSFNSESSVPVADISTIKKEDRKRKVTNDYERNPKKACL